MKNTLQMVARNESAGVDFRTATQSMSEIAFYIHYRLMESWRISAIPHRSVTGFHHHHCACSPKFYWRRGRGGAFQQKKGEIGGQGLRIQPPNHRSDLATMIRGVVGQMLHEVR